MAYNVTKIKLPKYEEYCEKIKKIWLNNHVTNFGPLEKELENCLCNYLNVENIVIVNNGTTALLLAIKYFDLNVGDEILTSPFSFPATTHAISFIGMTPKFVDIVSNEIPLMDPLETELNISEKTKLIIPTHIYGIPCDLERFETISKKHNIPIIYDASHCMGCKDDKINIFDYGSLSTLSFHATKIFSTIEGGAIICSTKKQKNILEQIKNFGFNNNRSLICDGINGKLNEFQAAYGILKLKDIEDEIEAKKKIHKFYDQNILWNENIKKIKTEYLKHHNYIYYPILVNDAKKVSSELENSDINVRRYFFPLAKDNYKNPSPFPNKSKFVSEHVICLPMGYDLTHNDLIFITEKVNNLTG